MKLQIIQRFWLKVRKTRGCWEWTASQRNKGYGAFTYTDDDGEVVQDRAHCFAWTLKHGPIPKGKCVLHKCDNPKCVRLSHLFLGTKADNNADMVKKGRHVPGGTHCGSTGKWKSEKSHWNYRLSPSTVRMIRARKEAGDSYSTLKRKFGVSIGHLHRIVNGKARKRVI